MTYTLDLNGTRYELTKDFKEAIEERARLEYKKNFDFSCWWKTEDGDPVLVIETTGVMVPWDRMDELEMQPNPQQQGMGRMHFGVTPHRFDEVPSPGGQDPNKLPQKPERIDEPMMVMWIPRHPQTEVTWDAGETIAPMDSWVEWNVQEKADQPRPSKSKQNSHDSFESLCELHGCEVVGRASPSNDIENEVSGSVERKGEKAFEDGRFGGGHWNV